MTDPVEKRPREYRRIMIPVSLRFQRRGTVMMGRQTVDQSQLFYLFNLEEQIPADHLLRRLNSIVTRVLVDLREKLAPFYSDIGRPSIDPELMIRMLIVGYCYGIRFERKLCEEIKLHLGYRWFCRLQLDDKVPDHSTFSVNRHGLTDTVEKGFWGRSLSNIDSRSNATAQSRFKNPFVRIRLFQILIPQLHFGDFFNSIDPKRTCRGLKS